MRDANPSVREEHSTVKGVDPQSGLQEQARRLLQRGDLHRCGIDDSMPVLFDIGMILTSAAFHNVKSKAGKLTTSSTVVVLAMTYSAPMTCSIARLPGRSLPSNWASSHTPWNVVLYFVYLVTSL